MQERAPSHDDGSRLAAAIGSRVRASRLERGWTLDRLASETGVSRRMIINVEQGEANPSIATLLRISDALGIGLPALVETPRPDPVTLTRQGEGAVLWQGAAGGRGILLAGTAPPDVVELWDWTLAPGDLHESEAHVSGTRELLQVLEGDVSLHIGEETFRLAAGDAVSFRSDVPHAYANDGDARARFSLVVHEPGVGATRANGESM